MATKNNPGAYDCYANAAPDEPIFTLRSTDPLAPELVSIWAFMRAGQFDNARTCLNRMVAISVHREPGKLEKIEEALQCAEAMRAWHAANPKAA